VIPIVPGLRSLFDPAPFGDVELSAMLITICAVLIEYLHYSTKINRSTRREFRHVQEWR
jgi:hypothetical protein